MWRNW